MRLLLVLPILILAACAQPAGEYFHSGNRVPAGAHLEPDGSFIARAAFWQEANIDLARQATIRRVQSAALDGGYETVSVEEMGVVEVPATHFVLKGKLHMPGEGPADAMPVDSMGSGVIAIADGGLLEKTKPVSLDEPPAKKSQLRVAAANRESRPLVIAAPDFIE